MRSPPIDVRERRPYPVGQLSVKEAYEAEIDRILVSEGEIEDRIDRLAAEITDDFRRRSGRGVTALCTLKGALRFFGALTPRLDLPLREGVVRANRYDGGAPASDRADVRLPAADLIEGRDVLVVEDLIDQGRTIESVLAAVSSSDPNSVAVVTLFEKRAERRADVDPEFTGFVVPDAFVVGYGIDYDERFRNLRHLAVLRETADDESSAR